MKKTAIVLPTAFITTLGSTADHDERIRQYCAGFSRIAEVIQKYPNDFDVFWVDNTIEPEKQYDQRLMSAIKALPNLCGEKTFYDNEYGRVNKGCGVIAAWRGVLPSLAAGGYTYVIHFEPRQEMVDISFFDQFVAAPETYLKVTSVKVKFMRIFSKTLKQFWTGLFSCPVEALREYCEQANLKQLAETRVSLETDLFQYAKKKKWAFKTLANLGLRWHDAFKNEYINI